MAGWSHRGLSLAIAGCLIASLAGCAGLATAWNVDGFPPIQSEVNAAGPLPAPPPPAVPTTPTAPVRVLQLNLCNSGIAACYADGRSIAEAAAVIRAETPDLVTLNEVCEEDVSALEQALAPTAPGGEVVSAFQAARDRNTGDAYRCRNGQQFGNGIVSRWPAVPGSGPDSGIYPIQDPEDPEERSWVCLEVAGTSAVALCTTHLAYTDRDVTIGQCQYLFDTVIAGMRARNGAAPVVLGGDVNLGPGDPGLRSCLPPDSVPVDDGDVQLVVSTPEFVVDSSRTIELRRTDHPGLLVTLAPR